MIDGIAIHELGDENGAAQLNPDGFCTYVDVALPEERTWRIYLRGTGALTPREEDLVRSVVLVVAQATADVVDTEELVDDRAPEEIAAARGVTTAAAALPAAAADGAPADGGAPVVAEPPPPPRFIRRILNIRPPDPFGHHDHPGIPNSGNCKPFASLHHADCAKLFSNNNEGSCQSIGQDTYRCTHGTLSGG